MSGLLESLFAQQSATVQKVSAETGTDPQRAEQAYNAAVGTIVRGLEQKSQTVDGADSLWDMLKKQAEQGNIPTDAPAAGSDVQVRDLDPSVTEDILKNIFGENAPKIEGGFGKVITLGPEATKKVLGKVLPTVLGSIFGHAEKAPQDSSAALPEILGGARKEIEAKQPKAGGIFDAIFDQDHDGDVDLGDLIGMFTKK